MVKMKIKNKDLIIEIIVIISAVLLVLRVSGVI